MFSFNTYVMELLKRLHMYVNATVKQLITKFVVELYKDG
jgi:hypothetical protein